MQFIIYLAILLGWTGIPLFGNRLALIIAPSSITATLYIFALFKQLTTGILFVKFGGLVLFGCTAILALTSISIRTQLYKIALQFTAVFFLSYLASYGMNYFAWDEFSHWGAQIEYLNIFGELPQNEKFVGFPEYIPGLTLWRYFARTQLVEFGPAAAYFAGWIIILASFSICIDSLQKWRFTAACVAIFLLFIALFQSLAITLYADPTQAALLMSGLFLSNNLKNNAIKLIPITVLLILSKHVGLIFCAFIFMNYLIKQYCFTQKSIVNAFRDTVLPVSLVSLVFVSWSIYVSIHNISKDTIDITKISTLNFVDAVFYIANIFRGLLINKFPHAYWQDSLIWPDGPPQIDLWQVTTVSLFGYMLLIAGSGRPRSENRIDLYFTIFLIIFYISFLTIIRATTPWIADQWSFSRYLSVVIFAVIACSIPDFFTNSTPSRLIITVSLLTLLSLIFSPLLSWIGAGTWRQSPETNSRFEQKARRVMHHAPADARVWYIHKQENSLDYFIFRMKVIPVQVEHYRLGWNIFYNLQDTLLPSKQDRINALSKHMCTVDLLFIDNVYDLFWEDYGELFDKPNSGQIFKVIKNSESHCKAVVLE